MHKNSRGLPADVPGVAPPSLRSLRTLCRGCNVEVPADGPLCLTAERPSTPMHQLGVFLHEDDSTAGAHGDVHGHLAPLRVELEVAALVPLRVQVALESEPRDARAVIRPLADVRMLLVLAPALCRNEPDLLAHTHHIAPVLQRGQQGGVLADTSVLRPVVLPGCAVSDALEETLGQLLVGDQVAGGVDATDVQLGHALRAHD
eukprot:CAMPEP_0204542426 /NCGR_PEP_ID=MMETSP0661-20131031/18963_1 /ASSEMBLY_ACC=CAM_ASM_000606 /TAXON_ID=109239 /ORGANISM="Alexandrium margalefi, Strain AMGDE01CS-322" /LENGTH=202 /DNA_ID=CAMNT_0051549131 /DNA_START=154 /DNA_END=759 /DNA_ORIENTATION=+